MGCRVGGSADSVDDPWWRLLKSTGRLEINHVSLAPHSSHEERAWDWLSDEERRRWERFLRSGPRRRFALCRAALRAVLCSRLGCDNRDLAFEVSEYGKPFALLRGERAPIGFNVSHSGSHGLIALAEQGRVGVDVEERRRRGNLDDLAETVFGAEERALVAELRGEAKLHTFYDFWTVKEALAKALGTGLHTDFARFQVPPEMRGGERTGLFRFPHLSDVIWEVENLGSRQTAMAVALEVDPKGTGGLTPGVGHSGWEQDGQPFRSKPERRRRHQTRG